MTDFTNEDIKMLAQLEVDMSSGKQLYVVKSGFRMAVIPEVMEELSLVTGQQINTVIAIAICKLSIVHCESRIAIDKAKGLKT